MIDKEKKLERLLDVLVSEKEVSTEDIKLIFDNSNLELTETIIENIKYRFRNHSLDAVFRELEKDGVIEKSYLLEEKEQFYITKKDFKNTRLYLHENNLSGYLFDSFDLKYLIYETKDIKEKLILNINDYDISHVDKQELVIVSEIIKEILDIENFAKWGGVRISDSKERMKIKILSLEKDEYKINVLNGLIGYYQQEVKKDKKKHLNLHLNEFKRLLDDIQLKEQVTVATVEKQGKSFKSNMTKIELSELVKSLIEYGIIECKNQENVYREFADFLNVDLGSRTLSQNVIDMPKRRNQTLFLDNLTLSLNQYLNRKNK